MPEAHVDLTIFLRPDPASYLSAQAVAPLFQVQERI